MKKLLTLGLSLLAVVAALSLSACGQQDSGGTGRGPRPLGSPIRATLLRLKRAAQAALVRPKATAARRLQSLQRAAVSKTLSV
jgi:hypothetical protein